MVQRRSCPHREACARANLALGFRRKLDPTHTSVAGVSTAVVNFVDLTPGHRHFRHACDRPEGSDIRLSDPFPFFIGSTIRR